MDYGELGLKVLQVLSPILLAALTWVAAKIAQYIQAKVKNLWCDLGYVAGTA